MNINELTDILVEIADKDSAEGTALFDHPCIVAIRAIDAAFGAGYSLGFDRNADVNTIGEQLVKFKQVAKV